MTKWPVTVAFTDGEVAALDALVDAEFDGDREEAVEEMLDSWLGERRARTSRFRY